MNEVRHIFYFLRGIAKLVWFVIGECWHWSRVVHHTVWWRVLAFPMGLILMSGHLVKFLVKTISDIVIHVLKQIHGCGVPESGTFKTWVVKRAERNEEGIRVVRKRNDDQKDKWIGTIVPIISVGIFIVTICVVVGYYLAGDWFGTSMGFMIGMFLTILCMDTSEATPGNTWKIKVHKTIISKGHKNR